MSHIIETKLKFKRRLHPSFFVRMFPFRYMSQKIGFTFDYSAFLNIHASDSIGFFDLDELPEHEKISLIVYNAAIEYCILNKKRIFFGKDDIKNALLMASLQTNKNIANAMSYARMPDWLQGVMDSMPKSEDEGVEKKN